MTDMDATIKIKVSANKMRAIATYIPAGGEGKKLTPEEVVSTLKSMSIITGIKHDTIRKMCESERPMHTIILADGIPPQVGEKARIEIYVNVENRFKAVEKEDGSVNYYDLGEICSATAQQKLYRKIPPTAGEPGKSIYGDEIPGLLGRDRKIVLGLGTKIDEHDPNLVRAIHEGEVLIKNGIMQISRVHNIPGDVDFSTGNVKFRGSVKIGGSVKSGFEVIADGTVEIRGNVEDARVISESDVIIQGGCAGTGDGVVKAKGDVMVKFVENQRIEADRDIIINGESFHATLRAGRSVIAKGKKGTIIGGVCEAKYSVETDYLGSVACPPTVIKLGKDPKLTEKIQKVESEIKNTQGTLEKIEKSVHFLYRQKIDSNDEFSPDKQALLEKLEHARKTLPDKLETLNMERKNLSKEQREFDKVYATADKAVFPKVRVYIGNQWITVKDNLGPSRFKLVGSEVVRLSK